MNFNQQNRPMNENRASTGQSGQAAGSGAAESEQPWAVRWRRKHHFWIGLVTAVIFVVSIALGSAAGHSIKEVQVDGTGKGFPAGTTFVLLDDAANLMPRDFTIEMKQGESSSRALIWDFAAEDGDVVTVKVNNVIVAENIGIVNKPYVLEVPIPSVVEVVGVRDGAGGITYGVKFPSAAGNTAYFNVAPEGGVNTYTLTLP